MSTLYSITGKAEGLYKEKGSKFISCALPVRNQDEIRESLTSLKKEYFDARHHCYAFRLGTERFEERANDDGEPNHSAGDPILGQIKSLNLSNILVVVIRYFGGTKLGVSGLVTAYKSAAAEALKYAELIEIYPQISFKLTFAYSDTSEVAHALASYEIQWSKKEYLEKCIFEGLIRKQHFNQFRTDIRDIRLETVVLAFEED